MQQWSIIHVANQRICWLGICSRNYKSKQLSLTISKLSAQCLGHCRRRIDGILKIESNKHLIPRRMWSQSLPKYIHKLIISRVSMLSHQHIHQVWKHRGRKQEWKKYSFHMNKDRINYLLGEKIALQITMIPHTPSHFEKIILTPHNYQYERNKWFVLFPKYEV